jgi:hypothetical protein
MLNQCEKLYSEAFAPVFCEVHLSTLVFTWPKLTNNFVLYFLDKKY